MFDDMPALVDAHAQQPPGPSGPWGGSGWGGGGVTPGGFGAGTPVAQPRRLQGTPHPGLQYAASSGPAPPLPPPPSDNPWLAGAPNVNPFSIPASAFDRREGLGGSPGFTPWAAGQMPTMTPNTVLQEWPPAEYVQSQEFDTEKGFGAFDDGRGWSQMGGLPSEGVWPSENFGQSPGIGPSPGLSPSPSTASTLVGTGPRAQYKRPEEWRPEFTTPRPGTLTRLFSIGKGSGETCA